MVYTRPGLLSRELRGGFSPTGDTERPAQPPTNGASATRATQQVGATVFDYADGHVAVLEGPGLGIEVDQHAVERAAEIGHRWRNPVWRHADGSFAEW